jgi:Ulp1 family protease
MDEKKAEYLMKIPGYIVTCPQQTNYYDCGIYLLQYVESFFSVKKKLSKVFNFSAAKFLS